MVSYYEGAVAPDLGETSGKRYVLTHVEGF